VELEREMVEAIERTSPDRRPQGVRRVQEALEALTKVVRDRPRDADGAIGIARS